MKLAAFRRNGEESFGLVQDDGIAAVDVVSGLARGNLGAVLRQSGGFGQLLQAAERAPRVAVADVEFLPPVSPAKIICVGQNYEDHRLEMAKARTMYPTLFTRFADTLMGHEQAGWLPAESTEVDYEGELAVIIGRRGRRIARNEALSYVAGYSCFNDISVRDWQRHTTQFTPGKNFPRTGGFGPFIVTSDEIPDPQSLRIATRVNGQTLQDSTTAHMIFPVAEIIEYVSRFTTLEPGDVIATGTPGGVGVSRQPQVFLKAGDVVEVEIAEVGVLRTPIVAEPV